MNPVEMLAYTDNWSRGADKFEGVLLAMEKHALEHGCDAASLPPGQARLCSIFVRVTGGRRVLEVGAQLGYGTLWLADALFSGGSVDSFEAESDHLAFAREQVARLGYGPRVRLVQGQASEVVAALVPKYDVVTVHAGADGSTTPMGHILRLLRPGGVLMSTGILRPIESMDRDARSRLAEYRWFLENDDRLFTAYAGDGLAVSVRR